MVRHFLARPVEPTWCPDLGGLYTDLLLREIIKYLQMTGQKQGMMMFEMWYLH